MAIQVVCPSCATKLLAPEKAVSHKTKCPKCGGALVFPSPVDEATEPLLAEVLPQPVEPTEPPVAHPNPPPILAQVLDDEDRTLEHGSCCQPSVATATSNTIIEQPAGAAHNLGVAALIVGVFSLSICWIPFLGIVVGGFGLLLGLGGLTLASIRRGSGIGYSIAGSGLSALSLVICLAWTFVLSSAVEAIIAPDRGGDEASIQNQGNAPQPGPDRTVPPPRQDEPAEWADASKDAVRQGNLQVRVLQVSIGQVPLKSAFSMWEEFRSENHLLMIKLELLNTSPTHAVPYLSWSSDKDFLFGRECPTLKDNFGRSYSPVIFRTGFYPVGAVKWPQFMQQLILPNKAITDVLVFQQPPLNTIEYLRLTLPAENFNGTDMLRFQIPKAMIRRIRD